MAAGIDDIAIYIPKLYVDARDFAEARGLDPDKLERGLGISRMAIVDANQTVISNQEFGYRVGFDKGSDRKFPVADIEELVPADARLVISLRPAY